MLSSPLHLHHNVSTSQAFLRFHFAGRCCDTHLKRWSVQASQRGENDATLEKSRYIRPYAIGIKAVSIQYSPPLGTHDFLKGWDSSVGLKSNSKLPTCILLRRRVQLYSNFWICCHRGVEQPWTKGLCWSAMVLYNIHVKPTSQKKGEQLIPKKQRESKGVLMKGLQTYSVY